MSWGDESMEVEKGFYFVKNNGQLQSPCEYALIQADYQVHFYMKKVIFYLTKEPLVADRIVMKVSACPNVHLEVEKPVDLEEMKYEKLRYRNAGDGIDLEFSIEDGMLVQKMLVSGASSTDELHLEFEGQKQLVLADKDAIRIEGVHESFQFKCPSADSVIHGVKNSVEKEK